MPGDQQKKTTNTVISDNNKKHTKKTKTHITSPSHQPPTPATCLGNKSGSSSTGSGGTLGGASMGSSPWLQRLLGGLGRRRGVLAQRVSTNWEPQVHFVDVFFGGRPQFLETQMGRVFLSPSRVLDSLPESFKPFWACGSNTRNQNKTRNHQKTRHPKAFEKTMGR